MKKIIKLITFCLLCTSVYGSETDQFTDHFKSLKDATPIINQKSNEYIEKAIDSHNSNSDFCDEKKLYESLRVYLNFQHASELVHFADTDPSIERRKFNVKESIYAEFARLDGNVLARKKAAKDEFTLVPVIRLGNFEIGTDKFMHLFGVGFVLFKRDYLKNQSLKKVLNAGFFAERTYLGGNILATGVYSYADLVANFNGIRFWNDVLGKSPDYLGRKLGPYIECQDKRFVQVQKLNVLDYMDEAFDETINCSKFASKRGAKKVIQHLKELEKKDPEHSYQCPIDGSKIPELILKYESISDQFINTEGHKKRD